MGRPSKSLTMVLMKRAFHIVYTILALNFLIPAVLYAAAPDTALSLFIQTGDFFGVAYPYTEDSGLWRILACANVFTLAFVCVLLQIDLLRFWAALYPLVFLKSMAALGFAVAWLTGGQYPGYLAAFLLDAVTAAAMIFFAAKAREELLREAPAS